MSTVQLIEYPKAYIVIAKNHAGSVEACAAISSMMTALANWSFIHGGGEQSLLPGEALVSIPKVEGAAAVYELAEIVFQGLADNEEITLKKCKSLGKKREQS
jgi:hypothetical protein